MGTTRAPGISPVVLESSWIHQVTPIEGVAGLRASPARNDGFGAIHNGLAEWPTRFLKIGSIMVQSTVCLKIGDISTHPNLFIYVYLIPWDGMGIEISSKGHRERNSWTLDWWLGGQSLLVIKMGCLHSISMYFLTLVFSKVSGAHQNPTGQTTFFPSKLTTELRIFLTFGPFAAPRSSPHPSKLLRSARYQCTSLSNFIPGSSNWTLVDCVGWEPPE